MVKKHSDRQYSKSNIMLKFIEAWCARTNQKFVVKGLICDKPNKNGDIFPYKELKQTALKGKTKDKNRTFTHKGLTLTIKNDIIDNRCTISSEAEAVTS